MVAPWDGSLFVDEERNIYDFTLFVFGQGPLTRQNMCVRCLVLYTTYRTGALDLSTLTPTASHLLDPEPPLQSYGDGDGGAWRSC